MVNVTIKVNGKDYTRDINPMLRLIDFLRDEIKLKGTKEGCGEGECGACTVIVNGNTVNSCIMLAVAADGAEVLTIEGLSGPGISGNLCRCTGYTKIVEGVKLAQSKLKNS
ncbi:MAG: (2Fe-2S)-binding protein [Clostridiales bacterium]|nr:(2Fe-2S)-binding protein [Clostridiales bacterium]